VVIAESVNVTVDRFGNERPYDKGQQFLFYFPECPPAMALYQGWFENLRQYNTFASLVFAHRNRDHFISQEVRENNPILTDQLIVALQKGWNGIDWNDGPIGWESTRVPPPALPYTWLRDVRDYLLGLLIIGGYFFLIGSLARYSPEAAGVTFLITFFGCAFLGKNNKQHEQQDAAGEPGRTEGPD